MTDMPYNMPPLGLFGKRCRILTGYDKRPFVYRIVNSELRSNTWCEPPITYQSEKNQVRHDYSENVLIVVLDTLISEDSRLIRVALKDVELMDEAPTAVGWTSVKDGLPEEHADEHPYEFEQYLCVTVWDDVRMVGFGTRIGDDKPHFWSGNSIWDNWVTHWMPQPKPPKEEENNA